MKNDLKSYNLKDYINDIPIVILGNITEPLLNLNNIINLKFYEVMVQRIYPDIITKNQELVWLCLDKTINWTLLLKVNI